MNVGVVTDLSRLNIYGLPWQGKGDGSVSLLYSRFLGIVRAPQLAPRTPLLSVLPVDGNATPRKYCTFSKGWTPIAAVGTGLDRR